MIKCSLDYVQSNDTDMLNTVFEELDIISTMILHSDKCSMKEVEKMQDDYAKELQRARCFSKVNIRRYIMEHYDEDDKQPEVVDPNAKPKKEEEKKPKPMEITDNTIS